jgi:hypothetical protein
MLPRAGPAAGRRSKRRLAGPGRRRSPGHEQRRPGGGDLVAEAVGREGLAARGLSNAEIALRLARSVRTAESHVYRATQKLGVGDRGELSSGVPQVQ